MNKLQTKNTLIALWTVLILSGTFAIPKTLVRNILGNNQKQYSLEKTDHSGHLFLSAASDKNLPLSQQNLFENTFETDDDNDSDEEDYNTISYLFNSFNKIKGTLAISFEVKTAPQTVSVPLYILFLTWKSYFH